MVLSDPFQMMSKPKKLQKIRKNSEKIISCRSILPFIAIRLLSNTHLFRSSKLEAPPSLREGIADAKKVFLEKQELFSYEIQVLRRFQRKEFCHVVGPTDKNHRRQ